MAKKLKVTLIRSGINRPEPQKRTIQAARPAQDAQDRRPAGQSRGPRHDPRRSRTWSRSRPPSRRPTVEERHSMGTTLHTLKGPRGATRNRKRIGRGPGSGTGKTVRQGRQGPEGPHRSPRRALRLRGRSDADAAPLPKRGFKNPFRERDLRGQRRRPRRALRRRARSTWPRCRARAWSRAGRDGEDPRRGRADQEARRSRRTRSRRPRRRRSRRPGGTAEVIASKHAKKAAAAPR